MAKLTQLSQESFNNVFNEDQGVFAVITRLFQTAKRFTEEVINLEIGLILEQAEPCVIQRCFGIEQRCLSSGLRCITHEALLTGLPGNRLAQHNMCMAKCTDVGYFTTTLSSGKENSGRLSSIEMAHKRQKQDASLPGHILYTSENAWKILPNPTSVDFVPVRIILTVVFPSKAFPGGQSLDVRKENTPALLITPACQHVADEDCASSRWTQIVNPHMKSHFFLTAK